MCQETYLLNDQVSVHPDNLDLFVNFDEVIGHNKPVMLLLNIWLNQISIGDEYVRSI